MYLTIKQQLKHLSKYEYKTIKYLARVSKKLYNEALYIVRQEYFNSKKLLRYNEINKRIKNSNNYKVLNANMAQQTLKCLDASIASFIELSKAKKEGRYDEKVKLPYYLDKDSFNALIIAEFNIKNGIFKLPYSRMFKKTHREVCIKVPPILENKNVKQIKIIPKINARYFEILYVYETNESQNNLDKSSALAIDLGIDNLATCVTSYGNSFIIDGKRLKSINQWYNKENARLQSIKDKQKVLRKLTKKQSNVLKKRNNRVNDYLSKTARIIVNYCINNNIGILVVGYNKNFQIKSNLGKRNNQIFTNIPFGKLKNKLKYLCKLYGIEYVEQEESYTSKASFLDRDEIPTYGFNDSAKCKFSGKRVKRGLYQTKEGKLLNADVNGALNILSKSKVVDLEVLYNRGELDTPIRIRVA